MAEREPGFYWVQVMPPHAVIAEWYDGRWWFTGSEVPTPDGPDIDVLSAEPLRYEAKE